MSKKNLELKLLEIPVEDDEDEYEELFDEPEIEEIKEDYLS